MIGFCGDGKRNRLEIEGLSKKTRENDPWDRLSIRSRSARRGLKPPQRSSNNPEDTREEENSHEGIRLSDGVRSCVSVSA